MVRARTVGIGIGIAGLGVLGAVLMSKLLPAKAEAPPGPGGTPVGSGEFRIVYEGTFYDQGRGYKFSLYRDSTPLLDENVNIVITRWSPVTKLADMTKTLTNNYLQFNVGTNEAISILFTRAATGEGIEFQCKNGQCSITGV